MKLTSTSIDNINTIAANNRYVEALAIAREAIELLYTKYGVEKVMLFGSLTVTANFRQHSDIDLAVWGLDDHKYYDALKNLQALSENFIFDLVQFESAQTPLKDKILVRGLTPEKVFQSSIPFKQNMTGNQYVILTAQLRQELLELEKVVKTNERLIKKYRETQDEDYLGTIALNLHSFYSGVERIFKQIAQIIDSFVPDTQDWHRQLLLQMTIHLENVRPPVITHQTKELLDEYCSFRHVVRNIYSTNLKFKRLEALAENLSVSFHAIERELNIFLNALP